MGIYTAADAAQPMESHDELAATTGTGLAGDRYATKHGTYSARGGPGREVTLVEREVIAAARREYEIELGEDETRRNLVTEGVPLHHLVGRTFRIGTVVLRGDRSCPPCAHLEQLTREGVRKALENRGGLRADVVEGGVLRLGDEITVVPD